MGNLRGSCHPAPASRVRGSRDTPPMSLLRSRSLQSGTQRATSRCVPIYMCLIAISCCHGTASSLPHLGCHLLFVCLFSSSFFSSSDTVAKLGPRRRLHGLWGQRFAGVRARSAVPEPLTRNMVIPALGRSLSRHLLPLLKDGYLSSLELLT